MCLGMDGAVTTATSVRYDVLQNSINLLHSCIHAFQEEASEKEQAERKGYYATEANVDGDITTTLRNTNNDVLREFQIAALHKEQEMNAKMEARNQFEQQTQDDRDERQEELRQAHNKKVLLYDYVVQTKMKIDKRIAEKQKPLNDWLKGQGLDPSDKKRKRGDGEEDKETVVADLEKLKQELQKMLAKKRLIPFERREITRVKQLIFDKNKVLGSLATSQRKGTQQNNIGAGYHQRSKKMRKDVLADMAGAFHVKLDDVYGKLVHVFDQKPDAIKQKRQQGQDGQQGQQGQEGQQGGRAKWCAFDKIVNEYGDALQQGRKDKQVMAIEAPHTAQVKQPPLDVTLSSHDAATSPCRRAASHDPDRHDEQDAEDFRHHRLGMMMIGTPIEGQESKKSNQQEGEESWAGMVVAQMNKDLELCNSAKMEKEGAATRMLPFRPPGMPPMMQGRNEPNPRAQERFKTEEKKRVMQKRIGC